MTSRKNKKGAEKKKSAPPKILNRKARHDYHILDTMEVGLVLKGAEVKSIREGKISLKESFAKIMKDELWLIGCNITPYKNQNTFEDIDPLRSRKLLLHKKQIKKLKEATAEKGLALIPLKIYFTRGVAKLELGVGKGKKLYDKREDLKRKDAKREMDRELKG
ncbi:tmRNA-binding protein SmpB [hydrothermal vent metagenome]|uniref:TmRNA-binding protein SmpB n=1 Tax=hydrothermal vent metagenome TaxID=652676 RepID=A0A3B1CD49_9ZZZZ